MKRLLLAFALLLLPAMLFAQATDRDLLLTPDGTMYTVESVSVDNPIDGSVAARALRLTTQQGTTSTTTYVPDSLTGVNSRPALAYDPDSKTLFIFWFRMPNQMSSELLLTPYQNGVWQPSVSIDTQRFNLRYNLRIGITRRVSQLQKDGSYSDAPALLVHAVWWEVTGLGEQARYALLTIDKGAISSYEIHDLDEFSTTPDTPFPVADNFNADILRHPAIIEGTDSVDVLFGDTTSHAFHRVTLKPIADTRIHIPIGRGGDKPMLPPVAFSAPWSGRISLSGGSDSGKFAFYNTSTDSVSYILYSDGVWSNVKTIATSSSLSPEAAVNALGKMIANQ